MTIIFLNKSVMGPKSMDMGLKTTDMGPKTDDAYGDSLFMGAPTLRLRKSKKVK